MNPEFRRQLWLQFSVPRLALLPVLLAAIFGAAYLSAPSEPAEPLASVGALLFALLVLGMGTLAAGGSVMDEIADRTWDQQRMSAMQPWAMTWGKLAGASAYGWYGGALCLLVAVPSAMAREPIGMVLRVALAGILAGVFLQAMLIAVNLQLLKSDSRVSRRSGVWAMLLVVLWGGGSVMAMLRGQRLQWWDHSFDRLDFVLVSLLLFTATALITAWRCMAEVLAVRQLPWGWPLLALVATFYTSGFAAHEHTSVVGVAGLSACVVLTYFALLAEPQSRPLWQRVLNRLSAADWRAAWLQLPRWPTTLLLALPFAVLTTMTLSPDASLASPFSSNALFQPLAFTLLVGRDCALALYFAFSTKGRRPAMAWGVTMFVLYALLPWLLRTATGSELLASIALPLIAGKPWAVALAAAHLIGATLLLHQRWLLTGPQAVTPEQ